MKPSTNITTWSSLAFGALTFAVGAGCNSGPAPGSADQSVGGTYQELATQLQNCASNALDCLKAADCDATQRQACRTAFDTCQDQTRAALQAFHQAVRTCFDEKLQCIADARGAGTAGTVGTTGTAGTTSTAGATGAAGTATNGGSSAHQVCHDQFKSCVQADRPIPPAPGPCMQGLSDCIKAGEQDAMQCFQAARTCFINRLPPRCDRNGGGAGTGASAGSGAGQAGSGATAGAGGGN